MPYLAHRETEILAAIKKNHQDNLDAQMQAHTQQLYAQGYTPKTLSRLRALADVHTVINHYLESIAKSSSESTEETIANNTTFFSYVSGIFKAIIPERLSNALFENPIIQLHQTILTSLTGAVFSIALGHTISGLLIDYFMQEFSVNHEDAQKQFAEVLNKESIFSQLIAKECERISVELIKLFHFREMLLLGKISENPVEPDARATFIDLANLKNESREDIDKVIELYFIQELNKVFSNSFKSLYTVQEYEISKESKSPVKKWLHQFFDSNQKRLAFTQEIQLKFMQLSVEYMTGQMNQPGLLATHYILTPVVAGLLSAFVLSLALGFILNSIFVAAIAIAGAILAGIATYFMVTGIDFLHYERYPENREHIQDSINKINNEYLALEKLTKDTKATSKEMIEETEGFRNINTRFFNLFEKRYVARGSVAGWLREYASRYRHSHAIEGELAHEYIQLMNESKQQNTDLRDAINKKQLASLEQWINSTRYFLKRDDHQQVIKESELIPKIKEQVLEIVGQTDYIPPILLTFYCLPITEGGLGGNGSDFDHFRHLLPGNQNLANPYELLCVTANKLYKEFEPRYAHKPIFYGDAEYRNMLGIASRDDYVDLLTVDNVDTYLHNSFAFLLSLCQKIHPGANIDPLQQSAIVLPEFTLYRMLLLKQLANICTNKSLNSEVKLHIKSFVKEYFKIDPDVIFDDLINQKFLLNKKVQQAKSYKNKDGYEFTDVELDNIIQAIGLDIAYNSVTFKYKDVLNQYVHSFSQKSGKKQFFAHGQSEKELNPQCTEDYVLRIQKFCEDTTAFLSAHNENPALTTTHLLDCYRYNMSLQVYRIQLLIVKGLQELSSKNIDSHFTESNHLLEAYKTLKKFSHAQGYALKKNSPLRQIDQLITAKIKEKEPIKNWVNTMAASDNILTDIEQLPEQLHLPLARVKVHGPNQFFKGEKDGGKKDGVKEDRLVLH
ncbi:MAG: hypothetical protein EPN84_09460 [Legionella sp.]|nr:MAG: hypothetical protein EPN84_09460 [Legionella sp.]